MRKEALGCGYSFSSVVDSDGFVWAWGQVTAWGIPTYNYCKTQSPVQHDLENIQSISLGQYHAVALDNNGAVWVYGENSYGQLGVGHKDMEFGLKKLRSLPKIKQVATHSLHTILLDDASDVWVFGRNTHGQLGLGHTNDGVDTPTKIELDGFPKIAFICAGRSHSIFIAVDGSAWACGENTSRELGIDDAASCILVPRKVSSLTGLTMAAAGHGVSIFVGNGNAWVCGSNANYRAGFETKGNISKPQKLEFPEEAGEVKIKDVSCGFMHTLLLDEEGGVWGCGDNSTEQLGWMKSGDYPLTKLENIPEMTSVKCGEYHSLFLDCDGRVWSCGAGNKGQLGRREEQGVHPILELMPIFTFSQDQLVKSARNI